ncbi:Uncharacterized protein YwqG [Marininema mesophilum]|uniref:Uncharacterized protein YwqG n=1 Tax=Marininema mesophilum TaxID=1048340 RepID=A0A1H2TJL6_9BACL|nr:YwqG family protein [Marininema mesophilum]SDW44062.1 Uncharacterized protein YwqG [Marininema mesophilum]
MTPSIEDNIRHLLTENGLEEMEDEILSTLIPYIKIHPGDEEDDIFIGSSKFGGLPDLPMDETYPETPGRMLSFLAQYNLEELTATGSVHSLPKEGMLYFFLAIDDIQPPTALTPDSWVVFYRDVKEEELRPALFPDELPRELLISERPITFSLDKQLPDVEATEDMNDMYFHLMDQLYDLEERDEGDHQAFGEPLEISGNVFQECALRSGIPTDEWVLLLQVDTSVFEQEGTGLGLLYFCIPREDLLTYRFNRTWLISQQH